MVTTKTNRHPLGRSRPPFPSPNPCQVRRLRADARTRTEADWKSTFFFLREQRGRGDDWRNQKMIEKEREASRKRQTVRAEKKKKKNKPRGRRLRHFLPPFSLSRVVAFCRCGSEEDDHQAWISFFCLKESDIHACRGCGPAGILDAATLSRHHRRIVDVITPNACSLRSLARPASPPSDRLPQASICRGKENG